MPRRDIEGSGVTWISYAGCVYKDRHFILFVPEEAYRNRLYNYRLPWIYKRLEKYPRGKIVRDRGIPLFVIENENL